MRKVFYVKTEENVTGPYSAEELRRLHFSDEDRVRESGSGKWIPAKEFDFDMAERQAQVEKKEVPPEVKGWNWGAFFFHWLWAGFNGIYWPLLLLVAVFIPYVGAVLPLVTCVALGVKGNEWAWRAKGWESVAQFKRTQRKWALAVLWVYGVGMALAVLALVLG